MDIKPRLYYHYVFVAAALATYVTLTFATPPAPSAIVLTSTQLFWTKLSLVVPIGFAWVMGIYGAVRLRHYAHLIHKDKDGRGFDLISRGVIVLVYGSIISSLFSSIWGNINRPPHMVAERAIISSYFTLAVSLAAYAILFLGARRLVKLAHAKAHYNKWLVWSLVPALAVGALYIWLVVQYFQQPALAKVAKVPPYYLGRSQILLTVVLPYLFAWGLAVQAVIGIQAFAHFVKGSLYKKALKWVQRGVVAVLALSVGLQIMSSLTPQLIKWLTPAGQKPNLTKILIFIYVILFFYGLGYAMIAWGARKLRKIEQVSIGD